MKTYEIFDGSYALASVAWKMEPTSGNELSGRKFNILASGCDLPANNSHSVDHQRNAIVAIDTISGQIVFTQLRFLRRIKY